NHHMLLLLGLLAIFTLTILPGCATTNTIPAPEHLTAIEQFLLTQAIELSLTAEDVLAIPLPKGETVTLETTGLTVEQRFLLGAVGRWLGEQGLHIQPKDEKATYRAQILIQSLGTEQSLSFFGMPEVQGGLLPFAIPELPLYKAQYQTGYTRFRLDFFETTSGKFVRSTPWFQASTFFNEYTVLFFIGFHTTNLVGPFEEQIPSGTDREHATDY
ncbi:MAG: hypothetical protein KC592_06905, partial [Nitrospira sp.]|nr:hypothetical protein [Nitrospira sp.]